MPYRGYRSASWAWVDCSARSTGFSMPVPAAGTGLKSMVITLIPVIDTCARSMASITDSALPCSPAGSTGRVSQTASLRCAVRAVCSSWAIASARRCSAPKLFSAAPSMSRSIVVRW